MSIEIIGCRYNKSVNSLNLAQRTFFYMSYQTYQTVLRIYPPRLLGTVNFDECSSCVAFKNQKDSAWNSIEFQFPLFKFICRMFTQDLSCLSASNLFTKNLFYKLFNKLKVSRQLNECRLFFYLKRFSCIEKFKWAVMVAQQEDWWQSKSEVCSSASTTNEHFWSGCSTVVKCMSQNKEIVSLNRSLYFSFLSLCSSVSLTKYISEEQHIIFN